MKRVVIIVGLVAVLIGVGLAINAVTSWTVKARHTRFNVDLDNFFGGMEKYKEHVGSYPVGSNAQIVRALMGQNPKKLIILVGRKNELNDKGEIVDPWGTPLRIYFAGNSVLARSAGPNRRFDDSTVLDCDDFFRSN